MTIGTERTRREGIHVTARRAWHGLVARMLVVSAVVQGGCTMYSGSTDGVSTPECQDQSQGSACSWDRPSTHIGSGPTLDATFTAGINALVDGNRLLLGGYGIYSIDLETGDRAVLSGTVESDGLQISAGSGPAFVSAIQAIRKGPDGAYYAADGSDAMLRVDPANGDRTTVTLASCDGSGAIPVPSMGFAFDASGAMYALAVPEDTPSSPRGMGIVRFAGGTCSLLSACGSVGSTFDVGTGPSWTNINSLQFDGQSLYVVDPAQHSIFGVDPTTGARVFATDGATQALQTSDPSCTTCGELGVASISHGVAWSVIDQGGPIPLRVDLTTGEWTVIPPQNAFSPGSFGGADAVIPDPTRSLIYAFSEGGIVVINPITGRSSWLSA